MLKNIKIQGISNLGQGFAFDEQKKKIFIPKTVTNDEVNAQIIKKNNKFTIAQTSEIIKKSDLRKTAQCEYFEKCGGCSLQHLKDDYYQEYKTKIVIETLSRAEIFENKKVEWIWIGAKSRRRVNFHVNNDNKLGFFKENSNELVKIDHCMMLESELSDLIPNLQTLLETLPKNLIKQISACKFDNGIDLVLDVKDSEISIPLNKKLTDFASSNNIINLSLKEDGKITPIYRPQAPFLTYGDIKIDLPSGIFLQASQKGQDAIINEIKNIVNSEKSIKKAIDLYCGMGSYSFSLQNLEKIDAFEGEKSMVNSLNQNAQKNNLNNKIKAHKRDLVLNPVQISELKGYDLALINPPRNGAKSQSESLAKSKIPNVIMVSCNLNSFTKDIKILTKQGYTIEKITAIDQFYYTHHIELVAHLSI